MKWTQRSHKTFSKHVFHIQKIYDVRSSDARRCSACKWIGCLLSSADNTNNQMTTKTVRFFFLSAQSVRRSNYWTNMFNGSFRDAQLRCHIDVQWNNRHNYSCSTKIKTNGCASPSEFYTQNECSVSIISKNIYSGCCADDKNLPINHSRFGMSNWDFRKIEESNLIFCYFSSS